MKICIISSRGIFLDEGQRNVASAFAYELSKKHEVLHCNVHEAATFGFFRRTLRPFNPEIIHIFLRANFKTFLFARICGVCFPKCKIIFAALQPPSLPFFGRSYMTKVLIPDCVTALSADIEAAFRDAGAKTARLKIGVNISRFHGVSQEEKTALRKKYGLLCAVPLVLHVGHITTGRNLEALFPPEPVKAPYKILVVASPLFRADTSVLKLLIKNDSIIIRRYLPNIDELYQASDICVFPTINPSSSIAAPLSVFEAMATNIPVITSRFGALPEYFNEGEGLSYVDDPSEIYEKIRESVLNIGKAPVKTREKVMSHTWEIASRELIKIYNEVLE